MANVVVSWYDPKNWGDEFGDTAGRPHPHRGLDIQHTGRTSVPVLVTGTVVSVAYSSVLGHYMVVDVGGDAKTRYHGYCHLYDPLYSVGARVTQGTTIARLADWNDDHGSAWSGPHLHMTVGPNKTSVYEGTVYDPAPVVQSARTQAAGGDGTPIDEEDDDMTKHAGVYWKGSDGKTWQLIFNTASGFRLKYTAGAGTYPNNNQLAATFGTGSFASVSESIANTIIADLDATRDSIEGGGGDTVVVGKPATYDAVITPRE